MMTCAQQIETLEKLRDFVNETLCHHEQLEIGAFHLTQRILVRGGRPCGIYYCLYGPRSVKFTAIWETERNTILFYDSTGERFLRIQLVAAPRLELAAA
jgi:hypothetical protein